MSLMKLLDIIRKYVTSTRKYNIRVEGQKQFITLSSFNINRLKNYEDLVGNQFAQRAGSDNQFIFQLDNNPKVIIQLQLLGDKKQKPQGSFFRFYHKLDTDLTRYDIHSTAPKNYDNNCLYIALRNGGLEDNKLNDMKSFVKCGSVPTCKLNEICKKLEIRISLRKPKGSDCKVLHFGSHGDEYKLGLIDNHYFIIEKTNLTSYCINNYDEVKNLNDWNTIYKVIRNKDNSAFAYKKSKERFIDSYKLVSLLLKNKDQLLSFIPTEDILSTQYFNQADDNENLEYSQNNCCKENEVIKGGKENMPICYFDFETVTEGDIHTPYLCCVDFMNMKETFYGEECGKDLIYWIKNVCKKHSLEGIILVAHNLRYDYTFIMDHLYCLKPVLKGNSIMGGSARLYYDKGKYTECNFLDSHNLISTKLSAFGKMFNLEVTKEIMPYSVYTYSNVEERFISTDLMLKYINEKDHKQFLDNVKKWDCGDEDEVDIITYSEEYCKIDVEVLKKGFETFRTWILDVTGLDIKNYCSIASLGLDYIISEGCFEGCFKISGRPRDFIQRCVVGGRCMTRDNKKWKISGRVSDFDAVSLYPSAMSRMKGFLKGKPKIIKNKDFQWLKNNSDGYFVKALCLNNPTHKLNFPLLSKTNDKTGIRDFSNDTKNEIYYLDKTLYEECVEHQGLEFKILCGYYYDEGHNDKINSVIRHLFQARIDAKKEKNPIQAIYKLLMNSCYGKCLLKPIDNEVEIVYKDNWENYQNYNYNYIRDYTEMKKCYIVNKIKPINDHFNNVYAGVEILSMSKRIMNEVMVTAEKNNLNMFYTDTDSIHIYEKDIEKLEKIYNEKYNRELIGKGMGQFHTDFDLGDCEDVVAVESIFIAKKVYLDKLQGIENGEIKSGFHVRMKGVSEDSIHHYCNKYNVSLMDVYTDFYETGELPDKRKFDLLCGGEAVKFQYNADMTVSSVSDFSRAVTFDYEKGVLVN